MGVLAFKDVQTKVKELIAANALFTGQTIVLNQGKGQAETEQALRELGQVVVVYPVQSGTDARNGLGAAKMTAMVEVLFAFNPEKGTLNIYEMVTSGIGAVLDYFTPNLPQDRFELEGMSLEEFDDGFWGYLVRFKKAVAFT